MTFTRACGVTDVESGSSLQVDVEGTEVAVVHTGDDWYAIADECSHASIALSEGDVEGCTLECWLHGSRFDLRTGEPTGLPAITPVDVYPVTVEGDEVYVDTSRTIGSDNAAAAATKES